MINELIPIKYSNYIFDYENGHIYHKSRPTVPLGTVINSGYLCCRDLSFNSTSLIHRMMYQSKYGLIPKGYTINHINSNKLDNRLCNLELSTIKDNVRKGAANRIIKGMPHLRRNKAQKIIGENANEKKEFKSITEASKELNINPGLISRICNKHIGYKSAYSSVTNSNWKFEKVS